LAAAVAATEAHLPTPSLANSLRTKKSFQDEWIAQRAHLNSRHCIFVTSEPRVSEREIDIYAIA
jgi:hypothetical protein